MKPQILRHVNVVLLCNSEQNIPVININFQKVFSGVWFYISEKKHITNAAAG
jgi:hypothetical protein